MAWKYAPTINVAQTKAIWVQGQTYGYMLAWWTKGWAQHGCQSYTYLAINALHVHKLLG